MPPASGHRWRTRTDDRTTTERGYGAQHQRARAAAVDQHHEDNPCARCGEALGPMGPHLHYDHNGARTGYVGFSHARCNISAGAREGRRRQQRSDAAPRRDWLNPGGG